MKEPILSLTKKDFEFETFSAGGKGGQNQNRRSSGVRVQHRPSGTSAESRDARDQLTNKRRAFVKLTRDPKFKLWLKFTAEKVAGIPTPEEVVEKTLTDENLLVEVKSEGKWVKLDEQGQ